MAKDRLTIFCLSIPFNYHLLSFNSHLIISPICPSFFSDSPIIFFHRPNTSTLIDGSSENGPKMFSDLLISEAILAFFLLLLLVWFLNREFEISYRLHYHGNVEADKHRTKIQMMRDQAEWLLGNIIPIHVADQLKVLLPFK